MLSSLSEPLPEPEFIWIALDVIRATSTIVTFLACGGRSLIFTSSVREARSLKRRDPDLVLMGERGGTKVPGFDLDNSPTDIMRNPSLVMGKRAVLTTTNGTRLLRKLLKSGGSILIGSMLNLSFVVEKAVKALHRGGLQGIAVACAGKEGVLVSDDFYCAGRIVLKLEEIFGEDLDLNDPAKVARAWALHERDVLSLFLSSSSGRNSLNHGKYEDVRFCSQEDLFDVVPMVLSSGEIGLGDD